jgi:hypothetical protein
MEQAIIFRALFNLALESEGTVEKAFIALIRAGKLAEVYTGPHVPDSLWASFRGLESSSKAVASVPSAE